MQNRSIPSKTFANVEAIQGELEVPFLRQSFQSSLRTERELQISSTIVHRLTNPETDGVCYI